MSHIKGKREYERWQNKEKLSPKQIILAQCYVCNGEEEGGIDCGGHSCPFYREFFPYRSKRIPKKAMTEAQHKAASERLKKAREARGKRT